MARQLKVPVMYLGTPMVAALITAHAFLPPHPGPTVVAGEFHADIGTVLLYGVLIAIPSVLLAGPVFTLLSRNIVRAGDVYAITCGEPMGQPGGTNMLKLCLVA